MYLNYVRRGFILILPRPPPLFNRAGLAGVLFRRGFPGRTGFCLGSLADSANYQRGHFKPGETPDKKLPKSHYRTLSPNRQEGVQNEHSKGREEAGRDFSLS